MKINVNNIEILVRAVNDTYNMFPKRKYNKTVDKYNMRKFLTISSAKREIY